MRERPYYDLERAVLLLQTQSPAHHSLSHPQTRMKLRRRVGCGPGGHASSLRRPLQEGPLGSSELLLTRWIPVLPEEFQASCSSCFGLRCIKGRLATGLHLSGTQGVGSPSVLRAQVNTNWPLEASNPSCARQRVSSSRVIQRCRCHDHYPAEGS